MARKVSVIPTRPALQGAPWELADAMAIKAVAGGAADQHQQKRAMDWIVKQACMIGGISHVPGEPHDTAFNEGKRFVGAQILHFVTTSSDALRREAGKNDPKPTEQP